MRSRQHANKKSIIYSQFGLPVAKPLEAARSDAAKPP